ncbi:MAG: hypothetical protein IJV41_08355 [Oscillospiraceae bacterium]|nr:hypothetical protein [Oscillospiraceae bacterium]
MARTEKNPRVERQSNMELLRILAAMGVIALHYNDAAMFSGLGKEINLLVLDLDECLWAWPVDVFLMLSGFFSWKKEKVNGKKAFQLYFQLMIFQQAASVIHAVSAGIWPSRGEILANLLPTNYFVVLYLAVYFISPFLNTLLNSLGAEGRKRLVLLSLGIFSVYAYGMDVLSVILDTGLNQASPVSLAGDVSGHTVVNFILCYLLGAEISRRDISIPRPLLTFFGSTAVVMLLSQVFGGAYLAISYCSPFVLLQGASLLCFFRELDIGYVRPVNVLAGASFTVYLAQGLFFPLCGRERFMWARPYVLFGHIVLCQIGIYLLCFVVYLVYTGLTSPLFRGLTGPKTDAHMKNS